jgi:2-haloacid dehalogenase
MTDDASAAGAAVDTIVFDLGGVLIDWDPRYAYRALFAEDEAGMERFLAEVCTSDWNHSLDAGRSMAEAIDALVALHPEKAELITAWWERWPQMLRGPIDGTVEILETLHADGVPLYALTNWSAETFPIARERFPFLGRFRDIVVSGEERLAKPDRAIFDRLVMRAGLDPRRSVFIDDVPRNVAAAEAVGFTGILFIDPADLRHRLGTLGFLRRAGG